MSIISKSTVAKCCGGIAAITGTSAGTASMSNGSKAPGEVLPALNDVSTSIDLPSLKEEWITPKEKPKQPQQADAQPSAQQPPSSPGESGQNGEQGQPDSGTPQSDSQPPKEPTEPTPESPPNQTDTGKEDPSTDPQTSQAPEQTSTDPQSQSSTLNGSPDGTLNLCQQLIYSVFAIENTDFSNGLNVANGTIFSANINSLEEIFKVVGQHKDNPDQINCTNSVDTSSNS